MQVEILKNLGYLFEEYLSSKNLSLKNLIRKIRLTRNLISLIGVL